MRTLKRLKVAAPWAALLALVLAAVPAHAQRYRVPGVGGTLNPYNYYDPYGYSRRAAFNIALYGRAMSRVPPYALGYRSYYPYYPYPIGYPVSSPYSGGYDPYEPDFNVWGLTAPARPVLTAEEKDVRALLAASGVPTDDGRPVWPVALRVLPGQEAKELREQIDALLQTAATQAARGRPSATVVEELAQATDHLRRLLLQHREERGGLAEASYEDAERFLDKLGGARRLLRIELAPAPSGPGGEGKGGSEAPDHRP